MDAVIKALMAKMTLEEKIGQLNLVTPGGGIVTGSVVSKGVEENIRNGAVGGLFGIYGPEKVRQAQDLADAGASGFDLVGAGAESIAAAKAGWGPRLVPYYYLQQYGVRRMGAYVYRGLQEMYGKRFSGGRSEEA